jgi:membrane protein implicated in regulation of membrane protease activity
VLFLGGILLAVFVLPSPWGLVAVVVGGVLDILESLGLLWWSKRRRVETGANALVGQTAIVANPTQVRIVGELWQARAKRPLVPGEEVVVRAVEGLTLFVDDR